MLTKSQFQQIYREESPGLIRIFYYKTGDEHQAKDLVQEAFVRLWERRETVRREKAGGFLYTVAHRLFLDAKKHEKVVLKFRLTSGKRESNRDPSFILEEKEFERQLNALIDGLPEGAREAFLLSRMEDMTYAQIAERLEISQKAVEKRISIALRTLRKLHKKV
ncbi:MAG: sigma-70 family RNA polymerase sigma factor [Saprospiraceae bacterium]|nr:sigma-70 family RNA polymerase sigma factor [Saprospiraceae bacterium]